MVESFPFMLFFKDNKVYRYIGDIDFNSLLEFLSADNYLDAKVYFEDLQDFYEKNTG